MTYIRYSRWDGSQQAFKLDADEALDAIGELLMEGLTLDEALRLFGRLSGSLPGLDFRIVSLSELVDELREAIDQLARNHHLRESLSEFQRALEEALDWEDGALAREHKPESPEYTDFLSRRHAPAQTFSERIDAFDDYPFVSEEAEERFDELRAERDAIREFEDLESQHGERFRGPVPADFDEGLDMLRQVQALGELIQGLESGQLDGLDPEALSQLLGDDAARSLVWVRDLERTLRARGYIADGKDSPRLTARAIRRLGEKAVADVYGRLKKNRAGQHELGDRAGAASPRPDEHRPYRFGDPLDLDAVATLLAALGRNPTSTGPDAPLRISPADFRIRERDTTTETTTVLLLDLSWSMSFGGRLAAAKRVAIALEHLVRTRFPRDRFFVVGFSTQARELLPAELAEVTWDAGEPFTNLQAGLMLAERLLARHMTPSPQILLITDGQPTAYYLNGELHAEWPMGMGAVSPRAVTQTLSAVRRVTRRGATINTFMLDDAPELVGFVERMTEINRGRAFFSSPERLGTYITVDYLGRRR